MPAPIVCGFRRACCRSTRSDVGFESDAVLRPLAPLPLEALLVRELFVHEYASWVPVLNRSASGQVDAIVLSVAKTEICTERDAVLPTLPTQSAFVLALSWKLVEGKGRRYRGMGMHLICACICGGLHRTLYLSQISALNLAALVHDTTLCGYSDKVARDGHPFCCFFPFPFLDC